MKPSQTNSDDGGMDIVCAAARPDFAVAPDPTARRSLPIQKILFVLRQLRWPWRNLRVLWTSEDWRFYGVQFTDLKASADTVSRLPQGVRSASEVIHVNRLQDTWVRLQGTCLQNCRQPSLHMA